MLHPSTGVPIYCRCIVGLALHEIQIGVSEPEGAAVVRQLSVALLTLQCFILLICILFYFFGSVDMVLYLVVVSSRFNCTFFSFASSRYILKIQNSPVCDAVLTGRELPTFRRSLCLHLQCLCWPSSLAFVERTSNLCLTLSIGRFHPFIGHRGP
jgi:hypothetical protein